MIQRLLPCLLTLLFMLSLTSAAAANGPDDHGRDDGKDRGREHRHDPLTPEQTDQALEILGRIDPEAAQRITKLRQEHPDRVEKELRRRLSRLELFLALRRYDPQMYELRIEDYRLAHESRELAEKLIEARRDDDPKEKELADKLEKLVEEHFDVRQKMRERELTRLEERIERLREQLDERDDDRKDLIEQRLKELTEDGEKTQW